LEIESACIDLGMNFGGAAFGLRRWIIRPYRNIESVFARA
jgi:hypothetical protein